MTTAHVNLYQQLKDAGVELDSHESDLYAKVTPESREIVKASGWRVVSQFEFLRLVQTEHRRATMPACLNAQAKTRT